MRARYAVLGSDHFSFARALKRHGLEVTFCADDPADTVRLQDALRGSDPAVLQSGDPLPANAIPLGAVEGRINTQIDLQWPSHSETIALFHQSHRGFTCIEQLGADPDGHLSTLAKELNCHVWKLPRNAVPVSTRISVSLTTCVEHLLLSGAVPSEIDDCLKRVGLSEGPIARQDRQGLDVCLKEYNSVAQQIGRSENLPLLSRAIAEGRLGRKSGVGWFRYPGDLGAVVDPLVEDLAAEEARFQGIPQQEWSCDQINRHVAASMNEAFKQCCDTLPMSSDELSEMIADIFSIKAASVRRLFGCP